MKSYDRSAEMMRNLLFERLRKICLGAVTPGSTEQLYHLAGAINKSLELECRMMEAKTNAKLASRSTDAGKARVGAGRVEYTEPRKVPNV